MSESHAVVARLPRAAALACALSGLATLAAWAFGVPWMRSPLPQALAMNPVTATAFLAAGLSLWLAERGSPRALGALLGGAIATIGLARLLAASGAISYRVDHLLFPERLAASAAFRLGDMAPNTATNWILAGVALLALHTGTRAARRLGDFLAMISAVLLLVPVIGYADRLDAVAHVAWFFPTALNTAATFLVLDAGLLTVRPWGGLVDAVTDGTTGGMVARRLLPASIAVPIVVGLLRMEGERAGLFDIHFGIVLMVVAHVVLLAAIAWYTAFRLGKLDRERRAAERARALLASLVESTDDAIIGADLENVAISWNPGAERLYGYRAEEMLGKSLTLLLAPGVPSMAPEVVAKVRRGEALAQLERPHVRKDGTRLTVSLMLSPVRDEHGAVVGFVMTARDMTERKRAEEEIARLNEHLRRHAEQLAEANRELEAFSYSVSHDLRAPLRHVDGFADLLARHAGPTLDEKGRRYLETIGSSAKSMGQLIDDLLAFSRMGRTELRKTGVELNALVREVLGGLAQESAGRDIDWHIAPLPTVQGDPAMLRVVFTNLLLNAVKYTRPRDRARIEVDVLEDPRENVVFVRDNGVGFDMAYAHKLFGVFQRLHGDGEFEGTGIGLANVRRVVHRHGGRSWAEGAPDAGATFYVSFPRGPDGQDRTEAANERAEASVAG
jgi:PAS domain S-box-containing protein